jgi:hypothetical protein
MPRRAPVYVCALALLLAAAGCGSGSQKPYTATATAPCLRAKGFKNVTTNPDKVGFVAGFAENGGLRATSKGGNALTIAFAGDSSGVPGTEKAFKQHASGVYKRHIADVMSSKGNAVLVWTVTPSQNQLDTAVGCLESSS